MIYAPGKSSSQYTERCAEELRCICWERGDRAVFIDGVGPYCIILDKEYFKYEDGEVGVNSSTIEAVWVKADCIPINHRSVVISGDSKYKVSGDPKDQCDGWMTAKLTFECKC